VSERILISVSCGTVGLAAVTEYADYGGEHGEEIEVFREQRVKVPRSLDFWTQCGVEIFERHVFKC
jgi:hypothetical protein